MSLKTRENKFSECVSQYGWVCVSQYGVFLGISISRDSFLRLLFQCTTCVRLRVQATLADNPSLILSTHAR